MSPTSVIALETVQFGGSVRVDAPTAPTTRAVASGSISCGARRGVRPLIWASTNQMTALQVKAAMGNQVMSQYGGAHAGGSWDAVASIARFATRAMRIGQTLLFRLGGANQPVLTIIRSSRTPAPMTTPNQGCGAAETQGQRDICEVGLGE